ncbi:RemK protein [Mycolicibacterium fortuitum]|uniref:methyltransferase family protein n=1 Tax=Mycolicibacterium fortuitum TaxID=1766 RepID=UPI0007EB46A3|nr:isoprenylcysteine carboxylmethyltransferase family protein [Mycolicibacterium fortuitum]OBA95604.1 RemK protein [Mycolicibacterium fortuitum]OBI60241.1 RemK protein [Mycolicibacterium fortuitum]
MTQRRLWWRHTISVLIAPATMTIFIPAVIIWLTGAKGPDLTTTSGLLLAIAGAALIAFGLWFLVWTVILFDRIGKGALAIGSPVNLVVEGPYRHVRNPMMTAVFCIQLGTAVATASPWLYAWFALFCTLTVIAIPVFEEPHLRRRFGAQYDDFRRNVPRWIPRPTAWVPAYTGLDSTPAHGQPR